MAVLDAFADLSIFLCCLDDGKHWIVVRNTTRDKYIGLVPGRANATTPSARASYATTSGNADVYDTISTCANQNVDRKLSV